MDILELLKVLPPWAAAVFVLALGVTAAVIRFGVKSGAAAPEKSTGHGEVIAVTADPAVLERLISAAEGMTFAITELTSAIKAGSPRQATEALKDIAEAAGDQVQKTGDLKQEIRDTGRDITAAVRSNPTK